MWTGCTPATLSEHSGRSEREKSILLPTGSPRVSYQAGRIQPFGSPSWTLQKLPSAETLISDCQDFTGELRVWAMGEGQSLLRSSICSNPAGRRGVLSAEDVWGHRSHAQSGPGHHEAWRKEDKRKGSGREECTVQETPGGEPPCQGTRDRSPPSFLPTGSPRTW